MDGTRDYVWVTLVVVSQHLAALASVFVVSCGSPTRYLLLFLCRAIGSEELATTPIRRPL